MRRSPIRSTATILPATILPPAVMACVIGAFLLASPLARGAPAPFADAVAVWHMADLEDSAGKNSRLEAHGDVRLGVRLEGPEREASLRRHGDGLAAEFRGGYLHAGQGADGELKIEGKAMALCKAMTLCLRVRAAPDTRDTPLLSKHGGHQALVYNLFCTDLGSGPALGFELGTDWKDQPLRVSVPVQAIGFDDWRDVIVRLTGPRLELHVDGVLVDEEWPIGSLRRGNTEPCLIGAESYGGRTKSGLRGWIDHAALWDRALSDDEIVALSGGGEAIRARETQILGEPVSRMQYWRPRGHNASLGDCMPFFHDGRFHLYYLFDRRHHGSKWGLGAHQWAHASTTDLVRWEHHPMAIPITEQWEGSICTGSVFFHDGKYHGYYATRMPDGKQHLGLASSADGIRFEKMQPNPFASPEEGYDPLHYRDPKVFQDGTTGLFHMLVTARLTDGRDGCLAQLVSSDLKTWKLAEPFIVPGRVTDCPDHFEWNGWYYLLAEHVYWISRKPLGPWTQPRSNRLDVLYVPKTAPFTGGRRIYVSWLPDGGWGGNAVFRELIQHRDGTLGTRFPAEMVPPAGDPSRLLFEALTKGASGGGTTIRISAWGGFGVAMLSGVPEDARIALQVRPEPGSSWFGLCARGAGRYQEGCELRFEPASGRVQLGSPLDGGMGEESGLAIQHVDGLDRPFTLEVILQGDIIDVCVDGRRTIIGRCKRGGDRLFFFGKNAQCTFDSIEVRPLAR